MADLDSGPLSFEGTNPKECEVFISTIRQRALAQGKHHDNDWIAFLASSYFVGDALYWYEELDEDVQKDWSRLRPALLARFGRGGRAPSTTSSPSGILASAPLSSIPTPAAALPTVVPRPSVRKGYLRVLSSDGSLRGYLAKGLDSNGMFEELSPSLDDALLVSFPVSSAGETLEMQIIAENASQRPQTSDILAISWTSLPENEWMDRPSYVASCCSFMTVTSKYDWAIKRKVWKISKEGELSVEYPKPGGGIECLYCSFEPEIYFRKTVPGEATRSRVVFEDVA